MVSPEVHDDHRVTIAIRAPGAEKVTMGSGEIGRVIGESSKAMTKSGGSGGMGPMTIIVKIGDREIERTVATIMNRQMTSRSSM